MRQKLHSFVFNKMAENSYLVWDGSDGSAVLVDPGCASDPELAAMEEEIARAGLHPRAILVTHPHVDHIAGAGELCRRYGIECHASVLDTALASRDRELRKLYQFKMESPSAPFRFFGEGTQTLQFGPITVQVLPVGGHTAGSVAYYLPDAGAVFVGDTVKKGSLGFLETGYAQTLERIRDYLLPLPDETLLLPGHGEASTIGEEKRSNRFFIRCAPPGRSE
ncbi:MAG: MBL fold metallo-hydrolase [Bacteroidales bacterium]|jgi:hydroxyacylglutathione hydrolase|nr:MBL fold metallo-hydrolase [Bacteroidales bacterium]